jgi:DNA mismatch repair protein MutS
LPNSVLQRASQILDELDSGMHGAVDTKAMADTLPLFDSNPKVSFAAVASSSSSSQPDPALLALDDIHPDGLTPRDALELLYRLKELRAPQKDK